MLPEAVPFVVVEEPEEVPRGAAEAAEHRGVVVVLEVVVVEVLLSGEVVAVEVAEVSVGAELCPSFQYCLVTAFGETGAFAGICLLELHTGIFAASACRDCKIYLKLVHEKNLYDMITIPMCDWYPLYM